MRPLLPLAVGINVGFASASTTSKVNLSSNVVYGSALLDNNDVITDRIGQGIKIDNGSGSIIDDNNIYQCAVGIYLPSTSNKVVFTKNHFGDESSKRLGSELGLLIESNDNTIGTKENPNTFAFNIEGGLKNSGENNQRKYK